MNKESTSLFPCIVCNKKSIYNFKCRCEGWTCRKHREPEKHNCKFDFSAHANNQNSQQLQKIEAQKVTAI